jgi:hypothetical protein
MSLKDKLQSLVQEYRQRGGSWPATSREIAHWAIENKKWLPQPSAVISQCADQIARALRDEYVTDPQGRRVRANHAVTHSKGAEQHVLWDDIRTATPKHMELAFQQRRQMVLGDCKQLKNDVDSYNENRKPEKTVQIVFDFTLDLAEAELVRKRAA